MSFLVFVSKLSASSLWLGSRQIYPDTVKQYRAKILVEVRLKTFYSRYIDGISENGFVDTFIILAQPQSNLSCSTVIVGDAVQAS